MSNNNSWYTFGGALAKTAKTSYNYTPFGELFGGTNAKTTFLAYNGESYDSVTGMVNLRARWHEPSTMRFSQRDIIRGFTLIPSTQNRYAYCLNNPILFTDPSGEFVIAALLIGAAIGAIIGGVSSYKAQKAATGKVDAWKVAKDALIGGVVGGVVGVVGAAVAGALATAVGATTLTATGLTTTLTLAQSVGVMSVSAVAAGTVARATNAAVRNSFTNEPKRDVAKEAFNPKAMTTDAVVGGISGVATYYSTGGVYSTTSIDRRYGGSTTPTSTKPTQGDKPNGSTSGDNPLDDAVRNASGEYAGEQANGAAQSGSAGAGSCAEYSSAVNNTSEVTNLLNKMPELTGTTRDKLLSSVQDSELRGIVDQLYRPGATVGDGGTASKLIKEFYEGSSSHLLKAQQRLSQLNKLANSGTLSLKDLDILEALRDDLAYAISLFN